MENIEINKIYRQSSIRNIFSNEKTKIIINRQHSSDITSIIKKEDEIFLVKYKEYNSSKNELEFRIIININEMEELSFYNDSIYFFYTKEEIVYSIKEGENLYNLYTALKYYKKLTKSEIF